ncbi:MAG: aminoglycoside phosphotransferase family protein [Clostridia bacterium]|nr:aminoglycoside phosphotransferase family protein [Clostridia bacterium]
MDISREVFDIVASNFCIRGKVVDVIPMTSGNINRTFMVTADVNGGFKKYVFQRINTFVFKQPRYIMSNIDHVTKFIAEKIEKNGLNPDGVMHFLDTKDGINYVEDGDGFWRVYEYVPNSITVNLCNDLGKLRSAGKAFGNFQMLLSDFDASKLYETIPNFHNTKARVENFFNNVAKDECGRVAEVKEEIEFIEKFRPLGTKLSEMVEAGELPLRVTHNDTKINNVLFDITTGEAKTVIDLDTVMPGLVAHDFGDAIRFAANKAAEDEPDVSKVGLDIERYRAFAEGFIAEVAHSLTENEIKTLALGAFTMTYELVVRFLDDYITGDKYFKTLYEGHNLVRTRAQLTLAKDMYSMLDEMNAIVSEISGIKI